LDGISTGTALRPDSSGAGGDGRRPVFWLRPVFVPLRQFLDRMPVALTFGLWGMFFLEGWTCHVLELRDADGSGSPILGFIGPTLATVLWTATYFWSRWSYAGAAYHFHADALEVVEQGRRWLLPLARVTAVEIECSRAQARLDLGSLFLFVSTGLSTGPGEGREVTCLRLPDVPHPHHARARIVELVEQAKLDLGAQPA
jgi:hypothetical protein